MSTVFILPIVLALSTLTGLALAWAFMALLFRALDWRHGADAGAAASLTPSLVPTLVPVPTTNRVHTADRSLRAR